MYGETYIKLFRSTLDNGFLMSDNNAYIVFTKLLMAVDKGSGSYITGRYALAELCNLPPSTVRDVLKRLQKNGMILVKPDYKKSVIHICNWNKYQSKPVTSPSEARHQPVQSTTLNKNKEIRTKNNTSNSDKEKEEIDSLNKIMDGGKLRVYDDYLSNYRQRRRHFTYEELSAAASSIAASPHMMGKNPESKKYATVEYLLRNNKNVDKWLTESPKIKPSPMVGGTAKKSLNIPSAGLSRRELNALYMSD